ncbi:MAG: phosphoesterase [Desulfobacterales bacterium]|nr:phosphoesterase [Desulfobacterales bacterium]MCP4164232.1 phosphoesterase [Deltaproteobacteria bacterium]
MESKKAKLKQFYKQFAKDDKVLIAINADPDAIASAIAVKRLLWRKVKSVTICKTNVIKRPDNVVMVRLLGVKIKHYDKVSTSNFTRFVLIDSQPSHSELFNKFKFDIIIDHHPDTDPDAAFKDIRPKYGATATIMTEYLIAAKIKPSEKLATGLFHAIKTDTSNFERHSVKEDMDAFQYLYQHSNIHLARKIEFSELQPNFLQYFSKALNERVLRKGAFFVHLGNVPNPDICVLIADFFMKVHTVKWSIVSGIYKKKLIVIFRNDGLRKSAGTVAEKAFAKYGSAGGHTSIARAEMFTADLRKSGIKTNIQNIKNWVVESVCINLNK